MNTGSVSWFFLFFFPVSHLHIGVWNQFWTAATSVPFVPCCLPDNRMVSMEPPQPSTGLTCSCDGVTMTPTLSVSRREGPFSRLSSISKHWIGSFSDVKLKPQKNTNFRLFSSISCEFFVVLWPMATFSHSLCTGLTRTRLFHLTAKYWDLHQIEVIPKVNKWVATKVLYIVDR